MNRVRSVERAGHAPLTQRQGCIVRTMNRRLTYANVMSTIAVFLAMGGSAYAAGKATSRVKFVSKKVTLTAASYDAAGALIGVGGGQVRVLCPSGYEAVGGGFVGLSADRGAITPTSSTSWPGNTREWYLWADNYSQQVQPVDVTAVCAKSSAL